MLLLLLTLMLMSAESIHLCIVYTSVLLRLLRSIASSSTAFTNALNIS